MIEPLQEIDDVIGDAPRSKYGSAQSLRIQDILRPIHGKVNEIADAVNDLQAVVHEGPNDFMDDLDDEDDCCTYDDDNRAWKETEPFVDRLHHLSTSQLEHLMEEAEWILEGRHRRDQTGLCPECQALAEAEDDDGYDGCCHCNCDCHDLPDDDDEDVTEEIQKVVDDVRGKNRLREIDTTDGLFADLTAYVARNPELRFWQSVRNWSGYSTIYGVDGVKPINLDTLEDTFYLKTKGPKKGGK